MMYELTSQEKEILNDSLRRTGNSYPRIQSMAPRNKKEADEVLPIVAGWIDTLDLPNYRHALYFCFGSKYAHDWIPEIVKWWKNEHDQVAKGHLATILMNICREQDLELMWREMCASDEDYPFDSAVLLRMTKTAQFGAVAKQRIFQRLEQGRFQAGDLWNYINVDDPKVKTWLEANAEHRDPVIRSVLRKLSKKHSKAPKWLRSAAAGPSPDSVIFSTEVDLSGLDRLLIELGREFGFDIPNMEALKDLLMTAATGSWHFGMLDGGAEHASISVWFRIEDVDVVEVVMAR
jgi:hypothetical protein